ncbi:hypothetical protein DWZ87_11520 [Roseburia intestinalis]|nr:hypothetical protein DWZ87_11520 [Roseburia intestinalis]
MKNLMAGGLFFFIGLGCQKVVHNLAIVKLHKAETVFLIFGQRNKTSSVLCNLTDPKLKTIF